MKCACMSRRRDPRLVIDWADPSPVPRAYSLLGRTQAGDWSSGHPARLAPEQRPDRCRRAACPRDFSDTPDAVVAEPCPLASWSCQPAPRGSTAALTDSLCPADLLPTQSARAGLDSATRFAQPSPHLPVRCLPVDCFLPFLARFSLSLHLPTPLWAACFTHSGLSF
jgi:hypothetical protein